MRIQILQDSCLIKYLNICVVLSSVVDKVVIHRWTVSIIICPLLIPFLFSMSHIGCLYIKS